MKVFNFVLIGLASLLAQAKDNSKAKDAGKPKEEEELKEDLDFCGEHLDDLHAYAKCFANYAFEYYGKQGVDYIENPYNIPWDQSLPGDFEAEQYIPKSATPIPEAPKPPIPESHN